MGGLYPNENPSLKLRLMIPRAFGMCQRIPCLCGRGVFWMFSNTRAIRIMLGVSLVFCMAISVSAESRFDPYWLVSPPPSEPDRRVIFFVQNADDPMPASPYNAGDFMAAGIQMFESIYGMHMNITNQTCIIGTITEERMEQFPVRVTDWFRYQYSQAGGRHLIQIYEEEGKWLYTFAEDPKRLTGLEEGEFSF